MARYGYIKIPHFDRQTFDKKQKMSDMGVDYLYVEILTAINANIMPIFYDLVKKTDKGDTIVVESIENLGFSNVALYNFIKLMIEEGIEVYSHKEQMVLTDKEHYKLLEGTQNVNKANQMKGIKKALENGVKFGREIQYATDEKKLNRVMLDYDRQSISWKEAADRLGIDKKTTFFYRYHKWERDTGRK